MANFTLQVEIEISTKQDAEYILSQIVDELDTAAEIGKYPELKVLGTALLE